jgi:PAS domain S-box-containing protein
MLTTAALSRHNENLAMGLASLARALAWVTIALGAGVFILWFINPEILGAMSPGSVTRPFGALLFMMYGAALLLSSNSLATPSQKVLAQVLTLMALAIAITRVLHLLGFGIDLDRLVFGALMNDLRVPQTARIAPAGLLAYLLLGVSLLLYDFRWRSGTRPYQITAVTAAMLGISGAIGLAYAAEPPVFVSSSFGPVSPYAAFALITLSTALLLSRPTVGIMVPVTNRTLGGILIRRLILVLLVFPFVLGYLRLRGEELGLFGPEFGTAAYVFIVAALFTGLVWWTAILLDRLDAKRQVGERALRESEERFRNIVDTAQEGVWVLDLKARTTYVNQRMLEMLGYREDEVLGRPLYEFMDDTVRPEAETHFSRRSEGFRESYDFQFRRKDGSTLWAIVASGPLRDGAGRFSGALKMVIDITERKQAEEQLRNSELALANAQQIARLGSWEWDVASGSLEWSDELYRLYGVSPETFRPTFEGFIERVHPDDREFVRQQVQQAYDTQLPLKFEHRLVRPDGSVGYMESHGEVVLDSEGHPVRMVGTGQDSTARKEAEMALRETEQRFRSILDNAGVNVYIKDTQGRYVLVNRLAAIALGRSAEELMGMSDADLYGKDRAGDFMRNDLQVLETAQAMAFEELVQQEDGAHTYWSIKFPIRDAGGSVVGVGGISTDITQRKREQQELQLKSDELEKLNSELQDALHELANSHQLLQEQAAALERTNKDLDDFAYIASHDLKEPLRGISNYARFLAEDYADRLEPEGRQMLEALPRLTARLDSLLDALLKYSRLGRAEIHVVSTDLNQLTSDVVELLRLRIEETGTQIQVPRPLPTVECDRSQTTEIYLNLISNAIKYNDRSEKIVELGYLAAEEQTPDILDLSAGSCVLYVRDNGIGIQDKFHSIVFSAFRRLHSRDKYGGGTGVGLAIVKKMVEHHGGRIWLESEFGQGTIFFFTLGGMGSVEQ